MGPLEYLLACGATVVAIARPGEKKWLKLVQKAQQSAGKLLVPMAPGAAATAEADIAKFAGGDCTSQTGELAAWIVGLYATHPQVMGTGPLNIYTGLYLRTSFPSDLPPLA